MIKLLLTLLLCLECRAATYYVATSGNNSNDGLTPDTPFGIDIFYSIGAGTNTFIVLSGTYQTNVIIRKSNTTIRSQVKWGARIVGNAGVASPGISIWPAPIDHCTVDGFEIANAGTTGIAYYGSNMVIRNCWVHDSGQSHGVNTGSGIISVNGSGSTSYFNELIEMNLLENNGFSLGFDHGIYGAGSNSVIRGNVCRGNRGFGISIFANDGSGQNNNLVYNNLCYRNYGDSLLTGYQLGFNSLNVAGTTNYAFGNTLITTNGRALFCEWTTLCATNNIIVSTNNGIVTFSPSGTVSWTFGDYNLAPRALSAAGPHDVITSAYGFVNPANGLYWLTSTSAARCRALPGVFGPVDFFGTPQTNVCDVGAFQYQPAYASDTRVLDPSSYCGADYWVIFQ